jgi:DNA mismatch repair ATPase MutS
MMLRAAQTIGRLELSAFDDEQEILRTGAKSLRQLNLAARWLMFEDGQAGEVAAAFSELLNLLFLLDVIAFMRAAAFLPKHRALLRAMFESIGRIDAAQSIAAWRADLAMWTVPEFSDAAKALSFQDLQHPLLSAPVANSLSIANSGVLITGSNMSGKTTFVRALGVNAVLAQTLHTVCARAWRAPMMQVSTSIGQADNILQGKSYYLAEVETALEMVRSKETGKQHLFLLDEIFRGTNTTERVAAAYALLSYLNRGNDLVVVATHDIELLGLLGASFESYHFRETIAGEALTFDFRIRAGPSSTRNAIALLEVMQFPADLVRDALSMTGWPARKPDRDRASATS